MAKKTPLEKFSDDIAKILEEYGDDISANIEEVTKEMGKKAAQAVKNQARANFDGKKYASGWTSQVETTRLSTTAIVYNKAQAGLAHLLEHGHVIRNGTGRTFGHTNPVEHIAPVEEEIVEEYQKEIEKVL